MTDLGTLGGTFSLAARVNKHGDIVGAAATNNNDEVHAVVWSGFSIVDLGVLEGYKNVQGFGINEHGDVVGEANLRAIGGFALPASQAFLFINGDKISLPTLGGQHSRANDINEKREIAGVADLSTGPELHAVVWSRVHGDWTIQDLGTLPGHDNSSAASLNKHGVVVGWSFTSGFASAQAFIYSHGAMEALSSLGGARTSASGINKHGVVVGWSEVFGTNTRHAVMWQDGDIVDLNSFLPPSAAGWVLNSAAGVSDKGDIVGTGTDPLGRVRAFILKKK